MNITVQDGEMLKDLIRQLSSGRNTVINIYYQVIGNIENSAVQGVNVTGTGMPPTLPKDR